MSFPAARTWIATGAAVLAMSGSSNALMAHHSSALYEPAVSVSITGTAQRFEWVNPHAILYLDVKDSSGNIEHWAVEMTSLSLLRSYGWARDLVKPGDVITCTGGRAKNGFPALLSTYVKLADGRVIRS